MNGSIMFYFCILYLFMGEGGMTFGLFVFSLSKHFICFSKGLCIASGLHAVMIDK